MVSVFPAGLDNFPITVLPTTAGHHTTHNDLHDAVNKMQADLRTGWLVNVKHFGAVGDGVTNDTGAIQAAIDFAAAIGGRVFLPAGIYRVSTLTLKSKVHLVGCGVESTVILQLNSINADVLRGLDFATLTGGNTTGGIHSWSVKELTIDGNKANNLTAGCGLRVYGYDFEVENVRIRNCREDGYYTEWSTSSATVTPNAMEAHVSNLKVHGCGRDGFVLAGPHDSKINGLVSFLNGGKGIYVKHNANMTGGAAVFNACHSWGLGQSYGWDIEGQVICTNCTSEGASVAQVRFGGTSSVLLSSNSVWIGGQVFAATASPVGFDIGVASGAIAPSGLLIHTVINNCTTAPFRFVVASNGGHRLAAVAFQTSGPAYDGTANANDWIEVHVSGTTSSRIVFPVSPTVPPLQGLRTDLVTQPIRMLPGGVVGLQIVGVASAVSYVTVEPAIAGNAVALYAEGPGADIPLILSSKGAGSLVLRARFLDTLKLNAAVSAVNFATLTAGASGTGVFFTTLDSLDSSADLVFDTKGATSSLFFRPGSNYGLQVQGVANAVNHFIVRNAATGNAVFLIAFGSDASVPIVLDSKGATSDIHIRPGGVTGWRVAGAANATNYLRVVNAATGVAPEIAPEGGDANIDLGLTAKGAGRIAIGYAASALGAGAAPTFGTVGAPGPTTPGQFAWLALRVGGIACFAPLWA